MKKRLIIIVIVVSLVMLYNQAQPKVDSFSLEDLRTVRPMGHLIALEETEKGLLAFSDVEDLGVDYFKPSIFKHKWVYGGTHSGSYEYFSNQYLPKALLKDFALIFGQVTDDRVDTIKVYFDQSTYKANIIELDNMRLYYLMLDEDQRYINIEAVAEDESLYNRQMDNEWLIK